MCLVCSENSYPKCSDLNINPINPRQVSTGYMLPSSYTKEARNSIQKQAQKIIKHPRCGKYDWT